MADRSWKPVRKGEIYCSPACGAGCTWADHEHAFKEAEALAARMGSGWKPHIWENMGWHYSVISASGVFKVHSSYGMYTAFAGRGVHGGDFACTAKTPEQAVAKAADKMRSTVRWMQTGLKDLAPVDGITQFNTPTKKGHTVSFFFNADTNLLVVDLVHKNEKGGAEIVRMTLDENKLLTHAF